MLVLDTNVLVAAMASRSGASNWIVDGVLAGAVGAAVTVALVLEYEAVLKRHEILRLAGATEDDVDALLDALVAQTHHVMPTAPRIRPSARDSGDDILIECAVGANADAIVTMNVRDLAPVIQKYGIKVLLPGEAARELRQKGISW